MTKYILHGGYISNPSESNKQFFAEMVKDSDNQVTILCVYFAREKQEWSQLFEQDKKLFLERAKFKQPPKFILAQDNPEKFIQQIRDSDTIYMRGGKDFYLIEFMKSIKNLKQLLKNKIVGGSSMGAYVIAKYYYSNDEDRLREGRGLLPIKVFAHYNESKADKLEQLKNYKEDLETYPVADEKFVVIKD